MEEKITCNTAYNESEAMRYDKNRFSDPKGRLFNKLEIQQFKSILEILPPRQKILEIGCGTGRFTLLSLANGHDVYALDPSPAMLAQCKKKTLKFENIHYYLGEGSDLPFPNSCFNFVFSIRTLNQVSSKAYAKNMIREMIRVCTSNGLILIEFINRHSLSFLGKPTVLLSKGDIKSLIKKYNYSLQIINFAGILFFSQTIMNRIPRILLDAYERIDSFFSRKFPALSTRCYITLKKKNVEL